MNKIKLEHIDNLKRGKKSGAKIGSRWVPHHLFQYEEQKYTRALRNKYLEINDKDRVNLQNLWEKVCEAKNWDNYILITSSTEDSATILKEFEEYKIGPKKEMKQYLKQQISDENIW